MKRVLHKKPGGKSHQYVKKMRLWSINRLASVAFLTLDPTLKAPAPLLAAIVDYKRGSQQFVRAQMRPGSTLSRFYAELSYEWYLKLPIFKLS